jgi:molybdenum cofactor biosynthesis protein B
MSRIDDTLPFHPVRIAVLTVSDSRTPATDRSGDTLAERLTGAGHYLAARGIVADDRGLIVDRLREWIADPGVDVILTTGGTGLTGRDVTVEAHRDVYDKEIEAFGTVFTLVSLQKIGTSAVQSRACGGVAGPTFSPCPAAPAPAAMPGTKSLLSSSTVATGPATLSRSCRAWKNTCDGNDGRPRHICVWRVLS